MTVREFHRKYTRNVSRNNFRRIDEKQFSFRYSVNSKPNYVRSENHVWNAPHTIDYVVVFRRDSVGNNVVD